MCLPVIILSPYPVLTRLARQVVRTFQRPIGVLEGDLEKGLSVARQASQEGAEVFVSRGATADLLRRNLAQPVVDISVTAYDFMDILTKVPKKCPVSIIGFNPSITRSMLFKELLDLDMAVYSRTVPEELPELLADIKKNRPGLIIGGQIVVSLASKMGLQVRLLESGRDNLVAACNDAYQIYDSLMIRKNLTSRYQNVDSQLKTVLQALEDPVLILERQVVLQFNQSAERFFETADPGTLSEILAQQIKPEQLQAVQQDPKINNNILIRFNGRQALFDLIRISSEGHDHTLLWGRSLAKIERLERTARQSLYNLRGHKARYHFKDILTSDSGFRKILARAREYASDTATVLITGETGTGKELLAQSIHNHCLGTERPFVAVNCASLPESLLESELFGYVKGAFTGAKSEGKKGLFELAHGGSLLLDEIGEMSLNLQSRLLRVIEERAVMPLGASHVVPVEVRLMASTNIDVFQAVADGGFRRDLYYRLAMVVLRLPPLRERGDDAYYIFLKMVERINPAGVEKLLKPQVRRLLLHHSWPGNLRELNHLVGRLKILSKNFTYMEQMESILEEELGSTPTVEKYSLSPELLQDMIKDGLVKKNRLAELMGLSRSTLWRREKAANGR